MAEKPEKKSAKSRYDKPMKIAEKDPKGEKVHGEKPDKGEKAPVPKPTKEDGPASRAEKHPDKGEPSGDAPTGMEESGIPVHARHAMERDAMVDKHMREHGDLHMRHEREHRMAEGK